MERGHLLTHDEILELRDAAISSGLAQRRSALLAGINPGFKEGMGVAGAPGDQILTDLVALRDVCVLRDGSAPLDVWLRNAVALAGQREEASVFERALRVSAVTNPPPRAPPFVPQDMTQPDLPPPTRYAQAWWRSGLFMILIGAVVFALSREKWEDACEPWRIARTLADGLQLIVVACASIWILIDREIERRDERSTEFVEPFCHYWKRLWLFWCVFYLYHTVREVIEDNAFHNHEPPDQHWTHWANVGTNLLHGIQSTMLLVLFWMMLRPTLNEKSMWSRLKTSWGIFSAVWYLGLALAQALLLVAFRRDDHSAFMVDVVAALVTGVVAMAGMGMFIGRLESAFLDVHPVELAALYVYAGIQPFYPMLRALGDRLTSKTAIVSELALKSLACALKLGLYFIVRRQLKSGRLAFYMRQQQALRARIAADWRAFQREK